MAGVAPEACGEGTEGEEVDRGERRWFENATGDILSLHRHSGNARKPMSANDPIPRKLHYCWFGRNEKPDLIQFCTRSWREHCPGFEIIEWNEDNFDVNACPFTAVAYEQKKYAFVTDYLRAYVLHSQGGIYLDADVEIRRDLSRFLVHRAFTGFERRGTPFTAVWGSVPGHSFAELVLNYYADKPPSDIIGVPNVHFVTDILQSHFGVDRSKDELQNCAEGLVVYPSNFFCVNLPENYATHHFASTWGNIQDDPAHWSYVVLATFYLDSLRKLERHGIMCIGTTNADFTTDRERIKWHASELWQAIFRATRRRVNKYFQRGRGLLHP
jgi:hypothetical protein